LIALLSFRRRKSFLIYLFNNRNLVRSTSILFAFVAIENDSIAKRLERNVTIIVLSFGAKYYFPSRQGIPSLLSKVFLGTIVFRWRTFLFLASNTIMIPITSVLFSVRFRTKMLPVVYPRPESGDPEGNRRAKSV